MRRWMCVELPFPPSLNEWLRPARKGLRKGKPFHDYRKLILPFAAGLVDEPYSGRLFVHYGFAQDTNRQFDIQNFTKAVDDIFNEAQVWGDDNQISWALQEKLPVDRTRKRFYMHITELDPGERVIPLIVTDERIPIGGIEVKKRKK